MNFWDSILSIPVIDSVLMWATYAVAVVFLLVLLIRRPRRTWIIPVTIATIAGLIAGIAMWAIVNATDAFGTDLPLSVAIWVAAVLGGIGLAAASLWRSAAWRKVVAIFAIIWFVITGVIGVNAFYGINPTLGSIFGIVVSDPIDLPVNDGDTAGPERPIYETWSAPANMPQTASRGTVMIPGTSSGFVAREASVYLPPAAQVDNAPRLPLVIMMMGHPGNPDGTIIGDVLDQFVREHDGLAPIVLTVDQLGGDGSSDPACADSDMFGNAETYVTKDAVAWANANLNVIDDPAYRVIAGYSNGGGCAIKYGAKYPEIFTGIIDVSGEPYPGSEDPDDVTANVYGGDRAAFEASWPLNIMQRASPGAYDSTTAIFTAGGNDPGYVDAATAASKAATAVGMAATFTIVPGADHGGTAVSGGLQSGFEVLYPVLGLAAPRP